MSRAAEFPAAVPPAADELWRVAYPWLILVSVAVVCARIAGAERVYEPSLHAPPPDRPGAYRTDAHQASERKWPEDRPEPTPMFSSNDRSRWATVRNLVDHGTYAIGRRVDDPSSEKGYRDEGIIFRNDYGSVDKVLDPETKLFYSSKPPFYATLLAGEYWLLKRLFGWSIDEDRWPVVIAILLTVNALPLAVFLVLLARLLDRFSGDAWAKLLVLTTACFGTFLTTFAVTLNNHTPAACAVMVALYAVLSRPEPGAARFAVAGFAAGFAASLDLPAAAFLAGLGLWLLARDWKRTLLAFAPAALVPVAGFLLTNHLAVGMWVPVQAKFDSAWYEYPGSHWVKPKGTPGIDFADEPKGVYAFHLLLGHHGVFSLMPVLLFSVAGMIRIAFGGRRPGGGVPRWVGVLALAVSVAVTVFYVFKTNNYGGWTSGPRWLFWMIPLWLVCMLPAAEWAGRTRPRRLLGYALLAASVFAVSYPVWNPWRHPWIYQMAEYYNWLRY